MVGPPLLKTNSEDFSSKKTDSLEAVPRSNQRLLEGKCQDGDTQWEGIAMIVKLVLARQPQ